MRYSCTILAVLFAFAMHGQDIHFSQFKQMPLHYHPALTGHFQGDVRVSGIQRTQWRSVTQAFVTFGAAADFAHIEGLKDVGAGLYLMQDRAGDSEFNTFQINTSIAKAYTLENLPDARLMFGAQIGFTQKSINLDALRFDNQWNGFSYDPSLATGEDLPNTAVGMLQLNMGAAFHQKLEGRDQYTGAFSIFQWSTPNNSFYGEQLPLDARWNFSAMGTKQINDEWDIRPSIHVGLQGRFREVLIGADARRILMEDKGLWRAIYGGVFFRTRDAGYILAGMEYDQWNIGLSYDINYSDLTPASNTKGGFEFSVVYIFEKFRPPSIPKRNCPDYL